jgi:hypothetical protein
MSKKHAARIAASGGVKASWLAPILRHRKMKIFVELDNKTPAQVCDAMMRLKMQSYGIGV